jgi:hypothetical protein
MIRVGRLGDVGTPADMVMEPTVRNGAAATVLRIRLAAR